ncbi:hypothetical protein PIB30_051066 [Stylosanthes scabra]|uniref:Uncharacterized protein n=1 Tax=Stylosanthes scabra TaxID=79078 RepID=A0ABU6VG74_9FABA|nr:hypothetical protein [Stylosanthes scabra]
MTILESQGGENKKKSLALKASSSHEEESDDEEEDQDFGEKDKKLKKKQNAYISLENEDDSSTNFDDDEVANICLMANEEKVFQAPLKLDNSGTSQLRLRKSGRRQRDLVKKAIEDGRLKFAEKIKMKMDADPFQITSNFAEIDDVFAVSVNMATVEPLSEEEAFDLDMFEAERPIYPKAGEDLLDFFLR